jgi:hypothetical protein
MVAVGFNGAICVYRVSGGNMSNRKTLTLRALTQLEAVLTTLQEVYELRPTDWQDNELDNAYTLCNNLYDCINELDK